MKRVGGFRRKTRHKLAKSVREKGKISLTRFFQLFKIGDLVSLVAEPGVQKGMYNPRFHGKTGKVVEKKGKCYGVEIKDMKRTKKVIVHPIHLKRQK